MLNKFSIVFTVGCKISYTAFRLAQLLFCNGYTTKHYYGLTIKASSMQKGWSSIATVFWACLPADIYQGVYLPCPYSGWIFPQNNYPLSVWPIPSFRCRPRPEGDPCLLCTFPSQLHLKQTNLQQGIQQLQNILIKCFSNLIWIIVYIHKYWWMNKPTLYNICCSGQ